MIDDMWLEISYALLAYNFTPEDMLEHGQEILQQLWYEFYMDNCKLIPV